MSTQEFWWSQVGCALGADGITGKLYGTNTPAVDAGPCIDAWYAANVKPGSFPILHMDGSAVVSGIHLPRKGGLGLVSDTKPSLKLTTITGGTITGNLATFQTASNSLSTGEGVRLIGFSTSTYLNGVTAVVLSSGLSATQFEVYLTHGDATIESGLAHSAVGNWLFQKAGSNDDVIHNNSAANVCVSGNMNPGWVHPTAPIPSRGSGIVLRNIGVNGNRGDGSNGNSTTGDPRGTGEFYSVYGPGYCWFSGVNLSDINQIDMTGMYFYQIAAFNSNFTNVSNVNWDENIFDQPGPGILPVCCNTDGAHFNGPAEHLYGRHNTFRSGDDGFAFNAAEGDIGPISDVAVLDSIYDGAISGGRIYTGSVPAPTGALTPTISDLRISGAKGTITGVTYIFGLELGATAKTLANSISNVHVSDIDLTLKLGTLVNNNVGTGIILADNFRDISFADVIVRNIFNGGGYGNGVVNVASGVTSIGSIALSNVHGTRSNVGTGGYDRIDGIIDFGVSYGGSSGSARTIGQLTINGVGVVDTDSACVLYCGTPSNTYPIINAAVQIDTSTTIANMSATGVDYTHFANLLRDPTAVQALSASNILNGVHPAFTFVEKSNTTPADVKSFIYGYSDSLVLSVNRDPNTAADINPGLASGYFGLSADPANPIFSVNQRASPTGPYVMSFHTTPVDGGTAFAHQVVGPPTAPTGTCNTAGAWQASQDGHLTYCPSAGGTWVPKI